MKEIIIKSIRFVNFKGLRNLTISFPSKDTDIAADNGVGKSSLLDGFTWVLFGKDRKDRKQFGIKTYDSNNIVIPRLPHEVEVLLEVKENGTTKEIKLTRKFNEKWVKQRGSAEEKFEGHEEERLYNDVPCSLKDWNEKITDLCPEQVFKFITNPLYFTSQKAEVQREMLIRMAGGITDAQVAAGNKDFTKLLKDITGKSMEEYKKEISAKKTRIKKELADIPGAIEERRRDVVAPEDWEALERDRNKFMEDRDNLIKQLSEQSEAEKALNERKSALTGEIYKLNKAISDREFEIQQEMTKEYRKQISERSKLMDKYNENKLWIKTREDKIKVSEEAIQNCASNRSKLIEQYNSLLAESKRLTAQLNTIPELDPADLKCPTCGTPYEYEQIEEIQARAIETHRKKYTELLDINAGKITQNKEQGMENNSIKKNHEKNIAVCREQIATVEKEQKEVENNPLYSATFEEPDTTPAIQKDPTIIDLKSQVENKEKILEDLISANTNEEKAEIENKIKGLNISIEGLSNRINRRYAIEYNNDRIKELEIELRNKNNELAELEGIEFTMQAFSKARIEAVEKKINSLFSIVKFKMFDRQINGGEVETCEATVDGVPFSDLNDAGRINAGLDIINAICKFEQVFAPVWLDNSESNNHPLATNSQRIRLIVSHDPGFVITPSDNTPKLFN